MRSAATSSQRAKQQKSLPEKLAAQVAIVMGSDSDWPVMETAASRLTELGVGYEVRVLSAHRSPVETASFARGARRSGFRVIIAGAGGAAHLAGVLAAHTTLPVIGVPLDAGGLGGLDALLSTAQMPAGVPVATMSIGRAGAENAAILAAMILTGTNPRLQARLERLKRELANKTRVKDAALKRKLA